MKAKLHVQQIKREEARPWILTKHYAHRMPSVSYAFGLYRGAELSGVCTFALPSTPTVAVGLCGKKYKDIVLELNRLCLMDNIKNESSFLVSRCFKLLPHPTIIVSYSDISHGHVGYVYQATNFLYTGAPMGHSKALLLDGKDFSQRNLGKQFGKVSKMTSVADVKAIYGDRLEVGDYRAKHRYVYFIGSKTQKKAMRKALKYPVLPYPKGESRRYDAGGAVPTQQLLFGGVR
jgi:hypothetical protein